MLLFFVTNDVHKTKQEVLQQISKFDIIITAKGFFHVDRRFIAAVINYTI